MNDEITISLCPFCWGNAKMKYDDTPCYHGSHGWYYVECENCSAEGGRKSTEKEAAIVWNNRVATMPGIDGIAMERIRQIKKEGWSPEHDDTHTENQLALAAACYALPLKFLVRSTKYPYQVIDDLWPWERKWWKPTPDNRIRELEKAGALIAAEIDRLLRQKIKMLRESDAQNT